MCNYSLCAGKEENTNRVVVQREAEGVRSGWVLVEDFGTAVVIEIGETGRRWEEYVRASAFNS